MHSTILLSLTTEYRIVSFLPSASFYLPSLFSMWQVHLSVSQVSVSLSVDCQHVGERSARPLGNLPTDGFEMLGKFVKTRGPNSGSAPVISLFLSAHLKQILALTINNTLNNLTCVFVYSLPCSPLRSSVTLHGLQRIPVVTFLKWSV